MRQGVSVALRRATQLARRAARYVLRLADEPERSVSAARGRNLPALRAADLSAAQSHFVADGHGTGALVVPGEDRHPRRLGHLTGPDDQATVLRLDDSCERCAEASGANGRTASDSQAVRAFAGRLTSASNARDDQPAHQQPRAKPSPRMDVAAPAQDLTGSRPWGHSGLTSDSSLAFPLRRTTATRRLSAPAEVLRAPIVNWHSARRRSHPSCASRAVSSSSAADSGSSTGSRRPTEPRTRPDRTTSPACHHGGSARPTPVRAPASRSGCTR